MQAKLSDAIIRPCRIWDMVLEPSSKSLSISLMAIPLDLERILIVSAMFDELYKFLLSILFKIPKIAKNGE